MSAKNNSLHVVVKLGLALAVLAALAFFAFNRFRATATVATVTRGTAVNVVTGSVIVSADGGLRELKSELPGRVVLCDALDRGKPFKKGDVLLKLDATDVTREMEQAERDYKAATEKARIAKERNPQRIVAKEALDNVERLNKRGDVSDEDVKRARRALDAIDTALELADLDAQKARLDFESAMETKRRILEKMTVTAPFDGATESVLTFPGAIIGAGAVVATIYADARVVAARISEDSFGQIQLDHPAKVTFLIYGNEQFDAKVIKLLPTADEGQRYTAFLEVKIEAERLKPNSTGEVRITVGERDNQPLIPRRALFDRDHVWVVKDGRVDRRQVEVGYLALNRVEIRKGLAPGEQVIVENLEEFRPGQRVRPLPSE
ncbi:MAG: efflux RND transporter periplasmic adaptor subunit [Verrucomicrobia bacterium]|nr:efflux RND transporter periplasmic adaptor subunit [Verrucomicrobiota bacterium]